MVIGAKGRRLAVRQQKGRSYEMSFKSIALPLVLFSVLPLTASAFETVALTGSPAPSGGTFSTLGTPVLSNTGTVAFYGQVDDNSARGIWNGLPGNLGIVARDGSPTPGIDGGEFEDFVDPVLSPNGTIAFGGSLKNSGPISAENDSGIWVGPDLQLAVREGDSTPGVDSTFLQFGKLATVNDESTVAFTKGTRVTSPNRIVDGIWTAGPGGVDVLALEDSLAPGTENHFQFLSTRLVLNASGNVGFGATLRDANSSEDQGIWVGPAGGVDLLAREGQVAPGTGGARFVSTASPSINANGTTAFVSVAVGPLFNKTGIWFGKPNSLELLVLDGTQAPGTAGATFGSFFTPLFAGGNIPLVNANDQVAFLAELAVEDGGATPDSNFGLWRGSQDNIDLIARKGSIAPGTGGETFEAFDLFTINSNDDVAFTALTGDKQGLWVNVNGKTSLVVLEGQLFDVDSTDGVDLREIQEIHIEGGSGGQDGRRMSFNDRQTLLFQLDFTDGSTGIFTTTVPEPSSLLFVVIWAACLLWRRG